MKKNYKARTGSRLLTNKEARVYGQHIESLMKANKGKIRPEEVVKDAEKRNSPLHDYFEWDDTKAGMQYRLQQARDLIANIASVVSIEGVQSEQRSFFNVKNGSNKGQRVYVTIEKAITTESYRKQLIDQMIKHLQNTTELLRLFKQQEK